MSTLTTVNRATGAPLAEYPVFTDADVDTALDRAATAQTEWAALPFAARAEVLRRTAQAPRDRVDLSSALS